MARPKTKGELMQSSQDNFSKLMALVRSVPDESISKGGVCDEWSIKDILAHLHAWHMLCLVWYQEGMTGTKPPMPAPGYSWKQTPELNQEIYKEYQDEEYLNILSALEESHLEISEVIIKHSQEELFTKKLYAWTSSTSMGSYFISATSSHYDWATGLIKKWIKINLD